MSWDSNNKINENEKKRNIESEIFFGYCIESVAKKCHFSVSKIWGIKKDRKV
jgi:hypothetical protein